MTTLNNQTVSLLGSTGVLNVRQKISFTVNQLTTGPLGPRLMWDRSGVGPVGPIKPLEPGGPGRPGSPGGPSGPETPNTIQTDISQHYHRKKVRVRQYDAFGE